MKLGIALMILSLLMAGYASAESDKGSCDIKNFPSIFIYDEGKNKNLATALYSISESFSEKNVVVTPKLLAAVMATLEKEGISYYHIPELGTPRSTRYELKNGGSWERFLESYSKHLSKNMKAFRLLKGLSMTQSTAIMCFEKNHEFCHRAILGEKLKGEGFRLTHL